MSREAFEAWFKPTFTMTAHGANPETAMLSRLFTWHGRAGKPPYSTPAMLRRRLFCASLTTTARPSAINDAIKEALK